MAGSLRDGLRLVSSADALGFTDGMVFEYLRIAQKVLRAHKFRSLLTVLSITIGAFSIVVMSSLAGSGMKTLSNGIEDLGGARLILVVPKKPERAEDKQASYHKGLTIEDRDLLFSSVPRLAGHTMYTTLDRKDAVGDNGTTARTDLVASDADMIDLFHMRMARGRGFSEDENRRHAKVCVVGDKLANKLFDGDALGHWLDIDSVRCRVIGQLANQDRWGVDMGFDWLDVAVLPFETIADVDPVAKPAMAFVLKTDREQSNEVVKRITNALLSDRHHGVDDFQLIDFARFMDKFDAMFGTMRAIVGFIAGIALLVGGIGVMNMMLVSVSERVREIGIRKALGASPRDIAAQFLWEAIVLAGSGGAIGVAGGIGVALLAGIGIHHFKPMWVTVVARSAVIAALVVSVGIGILFGFFPARRAARLSAIEAMRR
ncbi:MAG: ABC transporter permease [Polyangia bacterium]|jgi:putative ABC transport system permease protein